MARNIFALSHSMASLSTETPQKRKRTLPTTLSLSDPAAVAPYFLEVLPHLWSVRGFCDSEFDRDHRLKVNAVCELFLSSTRHVRDSEEASQVTRNIAMSLALTKQSSIKRAWQQCYDENMAIQSAERLQKRHGAQSNFTAAAALIPVLNDQLEGGEDAHFVDSGDDKKVAFGHAVFDESGDSEYHIESENDHDTTVSSFGGFENPPEKVNWIVGPGDSSSRLKTKDLWVVGGANISQTLSDRRSEVMSALELLKDPDMLAVRNFIYTPTILQDILSIDQWEDAAKNWQRELGVNVDEGRLADIVSFVFNMQTRTTLKEAVARTQHMDLSSPLHSILKNHLRTSVLWNKSADVPGQLPKINEDTFINDYIKPVMDGLLGDLDSCQMHWTRDLLECGPSYKSEEKLYPDFFLSLKGHNVAVMEVKAPNKGATEYKEDRRKLFDEMKLSVDGLLNSGIDTPVVGFLVSGQRVEVFTMSLNYEACYLVVDVGEFDLVMSRYQFGNLLTAAQLLLSVRKIIMSTVGLLRKMSVATAKPIRTELRRGTYYTFPCNVPCEQERVSNAKGIPLSTPSP